MQIVINIDDEMYNDLKDGYTCPEYADDIIKLIPNAVVIPKGHGRLTDLDEIIRFTYDTYGIGSGKSITEDNKDLIEYLYNDASVLVEADTESENE